jgi:hypothetical protein
VSEKSSEYLEAAAAADIGDSVLVNIMIYYLMVVGDQEGLSTKQIYTEKRSST